MKLATLNDGSRDGQLVVVSRDLALAQYATGRATRLQQVLDDWNFISPQLEDLSATLNSGKARHAFAFDPRQCMAPLPRAYQWVGAGPASEGAEHELVQRSSDPLLGPCDELPLADPALSLICTPGLAVITGDVPLAAAPGQALDGVRLLVLVNDWRLHQGTGPDPALAALRVRAGAAFGPVAVTPDELGVAWSGGQVQLPLQIRHNGRTIDPPATADGVRATRFGDLISQLARTRRLGAGCLVGGGTGPQAPGGAPAATPPGYTLSAGDSIRIEWIGPEGSNVFGTIEQQLPGPRGPA